MRAPALWPRELSLRSIRGRIALLLALAFLPAGALALQAGVSALAARNAAVQGEEGVRVLRRLNVARDEVTQMRETARTLAANADLFADNFRLCQQTLVDFARQSPRFATLSVLNDQAVVQCSSVPNARGTRARSGALILAASISSDAVAGFLANPTFTQEPVLAVVAPSAQDGSGARRLFVGVSRRVGPLLNAVLAGGPERGRFVALLDREGSLLDARGIERESLEARLLRAMFQEAAPATLSTAFRIDGKWAIATPADEGNLYLVEGWTPVTQGWGMWLRAAWALLAPVLLWLAAVAATWYAVEVYVARPLLVVEGLARSYARGEDSETEEELLRGAPVEISSLRRTLAALAKTLRGREARLAAALQEERALLLEVNHRVKNNLQMVASILSIQARGTSDASEARGLARAQDRVQLLALAHARIYASGEVREIALDQLAADIARALIGARGTETAHINLDLALEPVRASADRAVPLAFLIGESISSIFDLGAEGARIETLKLVLRPGEGGGFSLEIDADVTGGAGVVISPVSQRLTGAFARQIGAGVTNDPARPCFVRIDLAASAPTAA